VSNEKGIYRVIMSDSRS